MGSVGLEQESDEHHGRGSHVARTDPPLLVMFLFHLESVKCIRTKLALLRPLSYHPLAEGPRPQDLHVHP